MLLLIEPSGRRQRNLRRWLRNTGGRRRKAVEEGDLKAIRVLDMEEGLLGQTTPEWDCGSMMDRIRRIEFFPGILQD